MNIRSLQEKEKKRWDSYVMNSNLSTCYHLTGWKDVIEASFGHKTHYLLAEDENNAIRGVLPLVRLKSMLFGNFMVSLPYFNYGGICADDDEIFSMLLNKAADLAAAEKVAHIEFRHTHPTNRGLPEKKAKVCMTLALPADSEELWKAFSAKLRSQIRKPAKEHMYAKVGKEDQIDSFYDVFTVNMRDLGTPVYSKAFFQNILKTFPDSSWICTVYTEKGNPIASGFLVGFKERLEIPWASSLRRFNQFSPNMLLYWTALKFGCENGYRSFDFGRSTPGEGTYRFKEQWGAKPIQLYWHYWLRNEGKLPELNPKNPKYEMAIKIWQRLPVCLTKLIGPALVKNLP